MRTTTKKPTTKAGASILGLSAKNRVAATNTAQPKVKEKIESSEKLIVLQYFIDLGHRHSERNPSRARLGRLAYQKRLVIVGRIDSFNGMVSCTDLDRCPGLKKAELL